jgi:murein DD-endopeptidase MepM/ murein hydrolase activator NlpD
MRSVAIAALLFLGAQILRAFSPVLPTDNDALFRGKPEQFYMYTDRDFEGVKSRPWQGGAYGFTRNQQRVGGGIVLTKFHEGIDIKPLRRDAAGEPLDEVRAIEAGRVVHTSNDAKDSNYGKLAIIEHDVEGTPVYSIYAHLAEVDVRPGQSVAQGDRIGRLGYTGAGINQRRAHLHLEIALLWHDQFESWHALNFPTPNKHGVYNGINLMGLDVAQYYLQRRKNPSLTLPQFVRRKEPFFRVRIPDSPHFQLPRRYPWLVDGDASGARSWLVSFTAPGFPVSIEPSPEPADTARVEWIAPAKLPYAKVTRRLVEGSRGRPLLGESGKKLLDLLTWDPASRPEPVTQGGLSEVPADSNLSPSDE